MDVNNLKPTDRVNVAIPATGISASSGTVPAGSTQTTEVRQETGKSEARTEEKKELSKDELLPITRELNKFMAQLNADIEFEIHDRTKQIMVRVVDVKDKKVLKEFPPKELLDTIANIREYIGILLDKKA